MLSCYNLHRVAEETPDGDISPPSRPLRSRSSDEEEALPRKVGSARCLSFSLPRILRRRNRSGGRGGGGSGSRDKCDDAQRRTGAACHTILLRPPALRAGRLRNRNDLTLWVEARRCLMRFSPFPARLRARALSK